MNPSVHPVNQRTSIGLAGSITLEPKYGVHFKAVFDAIRQLMTP
jgi:hypothetical protein